MSGERVINLFRAARIDLAGKYTAQQWAQVFIDRVQQLKYPMGPEYPNFKCPNIDLTVN